MDVCAASYRGSVFVAPTEWQIRSPRQDGWDLRKALESAGLAADHLTPPSVPWAKRFSFDSQQTELAPALQPPKAAIVSAY